MENNFDDDEFLDEDDEFDCNPDPSLDDGFEEDDFDDGYRETFDDKDYEDQAKTADFMEKYLEDGEHMIWSQSSVPKADFKEANLGCSTGFAAFLIIEPLVFIWFVPFFGAVMILLGLLLLLRIKTTKRRYAITDRHVLMLKNRRLRKVPLSDIEFPRRGFIAHTVNDISERHVGTVCFVKKLIRRKNGVISEKHAYIRAVRNPKSVVRILTETVKNYSGNTGGQS